MSVECSIILEHSFFLYQQNIQDPVATAAKQYKSCGISTRVTKALTELIPQYNPQEEAREKMENLIMNVISQHLICEA